MQALRKRWWCWVIMVILLALLGIGLAFMPLGGSRLTQENCDRIQGAMSKAEVDQILGREGLLVGQGSDKEGAYFDYCWSDGPTSVEARFGKDRIKRLGVVSMSRWGQLKWRGSQLLQKLGL